MIGKDIQYGSFYLIDKESGECQKIGNVESLEIIENSNEKFDFSAIINPPEITVEAKLIPISRKRFIKLLMARNIQRNGAQELAKYFFNKRGYYSYMDLILFDNGVLWNI